MCSHQCETMRKIEKKKEKERKRKSKFQSWYDVVITNGTYVDNEMINLNETFIFPFMHILVRCDLLFKKLLAIILI